MIFLFQLMFRPCEIKFNDWYYFINLLLETRNRKLKYDEFIQLTIYYNCILSKLSKYVEKTNYREIRKNMHL